MSANNLCQGGKQNGYPFLYQSTHSRNYLVIQTLPGRCRQLRIYTQQKLLSHIDTQASPHQPPTSTHSRNYLVIQTTFQMYFKPFIYTQQKLLSHIDLKTPHCLCQLSTHSRNYLVIQTVCSALSRNLSTHSRNYLVIQTSLQDQFNQYLSTHSRNYLVIQTTLIITFWQLYLHIVEITQSYRHIMRQSVILKIYTQQKLLSHIDITQGKLDEMTSTHSRNYLVIQTFL